MRRRLRVVFSYSAYHAIWELKMGDTKEIHGGQTESWSSEVKVTQPCLTLCDPMYFGLPGSSVHGIFQAVVLEWISISFSRGSSQPRDRTWVSRVVDRRFTVWATREVQKGYEEWKEKIFLQTPNLVQASFKHSLIHSFFNKIHLWWFSKHPLFQDTRLSINPSSLSPSLPFSSQRGKKTCVLFGLNIKAWTDETIIVFPKRAAHSHTQEGNKSRELCKYTLIT